MKFLPWREELKLVENYIQDNEVIVPGAEDSVQRAKFTLTLELTELLLDES